MPSPKANQGLHPLAVLALILSMVLTACSGGGDGDGIESPNGHLPSMVISGRLTPTTGSAVDSDINDQAAPFISNDTPTQAQRLPNPVILGGYVNFPGAGPPGRSRVSGDVADWYEANLLRDQTLYVQMQNPSAALDVGLYDKNGQLLDVLFLGGGFPTQGEIEVTTSDLHRIAVFISDSGFDLATAYNLLLGHQISPSALMALAPSANSAFVPGELLIRLRDPLQSQSQSQSQNQSQSQSQSPNLDRLDNRIRSLAQSGTSQSIRPGPVPPENQPRPNTIRAPQWEVPERPAAEGTSRIATELLEMRGRSILEHNHRIDLEEIKALRARTAPAARHHVPQPLTSAHAWPDFRERWGHLAPAGFASTELQERVLTLWLARELGSEPGVLSAEPNLLFEPQSIAPNDPLWSLQWNLPQIATASAWPIATGSGTIVAVIDSGLLLEHPDLQGQTVFGYDFIRNIPGGSDPGTPDSPAGRSSTFHGTLVAGVIAARTNNSAGIAGVAHDAQIMPLRVCTTLCSSFAIEQAIRFAAGLPNASGLLPQTRADVINLSLGGYQFSPTLETLLADVASQGILTVAAAGNDNVDRPMFPAALPSVISVGATDRLGELAYYSNFGETIDLVAPGGDLRQDLGGDGLGDGITTTHGDDSQTPLRYTYARVQGTSLAAPHVSAAAALIKQIRPETDLPRFREWLRTGQLTDTQAGDIGFNPRTGYGEINLLKSVTAARENTDFANADPILVATPSALNFGTALQSQTVRLSNRGGGSLENIGVTEDSGGWIAVTLISGGTEPTYRIDINRDAYPPGVYAATLTFTSNANTLQLPVFMEVVSGTSASANAGTVYVLLLDSDTDTTVQSVTAELTNTGDYLYEFRAVQPGQYRIVAGSDLNNDGLICDSADSCGQYPLMHRPEIITVDEKDQLNVDFFVGYRIR